MSERKLKIAALLKELYGMAEVPVPSSRIHRGRPRTGFAPLGCRFAPL